MDKVEKTSLARKIRTKASLKQKSKRDAASGIWFGLGMMGLIGWSVAIPTLLGAALGFWLDNRYPGKFSWTLSCLLLGLVFGCMNAWRWVGRETSEIMKEEDSGDE
jgi:ATP synthase protein I